MRLTTLLVLCSILAGCDQISTYVCEAVKESCQHVLPVYTGVPLERGGLLYAVNSTEPLTARVERYHLNGQLGGSSTAIDGKLEGLYQEWHGNGQLGNETTYVNGKQEGLDQQWLENGQLLRKTTYVNGKKDGLEEWYYENERIKKQNQVTYVNGKKEGLQEYYRDGQLDREVPYVNGEREGMELYYEKGKVRRRPGECWVAGKKSHVFYDNGVTPRCARKVPEKWRKIWANE
jgi:hypothetical protein